MKWNEITCKLPDAQIVYSKVLHQSIALYTHAVENEKYYRKIGFETVRTITDERYSCTIYFMIKKYE